VLNKRYNIIP